MLPEESRLPPGFEGAQPKSRKSCVKKPSELKRNSAPARTLMSTAPPKVKPERPCKSSPPTRKRSKSTGDLDIPADLWEAERSGTPEETVSRDKYERLFGVCISIQEELKRTKTQLRWLTYHHQQSLSPMDPQSYAYTDWAGRSGAVDWRCKR